MARRTWALLLPGYKAVLVLARGWRGRSLLALGTDPFSGILADYQRPVGYRDAEGYR